MAQIEQSDKGGKKKKGAQKKMSIHVDFTPMVDMNMLLITFFMLCTTMIKSQTVQIILPAPPNEKQQKTSQADANLAMTLILDTEYDAEGNPLKDENGNTKHNVYYYEFNVDEATQQGVPDTINANRIGERTHKAAIAMETYMASNNGEAQGIRAVLRKRNQEVMDKYDELKKEYADKTGKEAQAEFEAKVLEIAKDTTLRLPTIIIKAGPNTTYENVINAFDELRLNNIRRYSFERLNHTDTVLLRNFERANGLHIIRDNVRKK